MSNKVTGFVEGDLKTNNSWQKMLFLEEKIWQKERSVYANQLRSPSTWDITHNNNFYFNKKSLDSNEIKKLCISVLSSYELLGININGIVSDGGSGNSFIPLYKFNSYRQLEL